MHDGFDFLAHVVVLVFEFHLHCSFAVGGVELLCELEHKLFALLKECFIVVTDDICECGLFHGALHAHEVIKSFVCLCSLWCFVFRHVLHEIGCDSHGVFHLVVRSARVYIHAVYMHFASSGVEVLVFEFAYRTSVHGVCPLSAEGLYIEMVCSLTYLFIRREAHAYCTVFDLWVLDKVFHGRNDFCYTCFVVCAE